MKRILFKALIVFLVLGILGAIAGTGIIYWASRDLPSFTRVSDYRPPQVTTIYARDGSVMGYWYDEKRFLVSLGQMPDYLPKAFLAAEDASFYEHDGISFKAILRAFVKNTLSGTISEGGSTITQQVVKRLMLTTERSYTRKLKEAILAYRLESYLSKDDILNIYLNQIYLGSGAYGVEAAARTYFGKHVEELALPEAAVLAGLPKAPSKVNPQLDPAGAKNRQLYVLRRMLDENMLTRAEYEAAAAAPLVYGSMPEPPQIGAWYLDEVQRELTRFLSEQNVRDLPLPLERYEHDALFNAGLNIYTCMEPVQQAAAVAALRQGLLDADKRHGWRGAPESVPPEEIGAYLEKHPFNPQDLDDAGWVKAVVVEVNAKAAQVRLGAYRGAISAKMAEWCREPNLDRSAAEPGQARTPDKFLAVGDIVWVSAVGTQGRANPVGAPAGGRMEGGNAAIKPYVSAQVTAETPIELCLEQMPALEGALISEETESGDVVALVGGYTAPPGNYFNRGTYFNRATMAKRQPGSLFKPVVYSAAIDLGFTAASIIKDAPVVGEFGTGLNALWRPSNFDGVFYGPTLLRTALVKSRNLCTIRLAQQIGLPAVIERAHLLGIDGNIPVDLSVSLGSYAVTPMAMTEAFTPFASGGQRVRPRLVQRITDSWGQTVVNFMPETAPAITPQNAYIISSMLKDVIRHGTGFRAKPVKSIIGGKTGTTNEERDAWFVGFSPFLVSTVYVGYDESRPMGKSETGSRTAVPIFTQYSLDIEQIYPNEDFAMPSGLVTLNVDESNGYLAGKDSAHIASLTFIAGSEPKVTAGEPIKRGDDDLGSAINLLKQ
ncbi:MAG: PBP1A family penicillin-binding protein [Deltaproteobacteria bacterium]|jgi:penicillin-binding protein 1A|nr:PBP1A family penicillin-binding protein [Deltaproteobacteria bacterium]